MEIIQIIILIFALFAFSRVFINIKNRNLSILESSFWLVFWSIAILAAVFPELVIYVSKYVGVERAVDLVIYLTIMVLAYLIFRLYAFQERQNRQITKIVRTIALRKK